MRLLIDAKCLQTHSRNRGIGRYTDSLLRPLLPLLTAKGVEVVLLADRTMDAPALTEAGVPTIWLDSSGLDDMEGYPTLLHPRILGSKVDAVLNPSPFEWGTFPRYVDLPVPLFSISYDLIPLLFPDTYLNDKNYAKRYRRDAAAVAASEHVFAISECTRQDTIRLLEMPPERVTNIFAGVSGDFTPLNPQEKAHWAKTLKAKYGLESGSFLLYTAGEDWRKNLEGTIKGYARLSPALRAKHPLAIVCKLREGTAADLKALAQQCGVGSQVHFTGFVPDEMLRALYGSCRLFLFPSYYEGFGLPVVEAMACGAPVCVADNSSLREIVTDSARKFNPDNPADFAACLTRRLSDPAVLDAEAQGAPQAAKAFNWERSAHLMAEVLGSWQPTGPLRRNGAGGRSGNTGLLSLGVVTPLPPSRSGISDYVVDLAPAMARHADIVYLHDVRESAALTGLDVQPETLLPEIAPQCDALLYHMGNSAFHCGMYAHLRRFTGFTVLHDYNLTGMLWHIHQTNLPLGIRFTEELAHQYGATEAAQVEKRLRAKEWEIAKLPTHGYYGNRRIFSRSLGVVLHSEWAMAKAKADFGDLCPLLHMPMPMPLPAQSIPETKRAARQALKLPENHFLIAVPGFVHAVKRPFEILNAFAELLKKHPQALLMYCGSTEYLLEDLEGEIQRLGLKDKVRMTGYLTMDDFYRYIEAADLCINLRYPSNGETSASVLRIMAQGKPVIVTDIDSFADYPGEIVLKVPPPDKGNDTEATARLFIELADNPARLQALGDGCREYVANYHDPDIVAGNLVSFMQDVLATPEARLKLAADVVGRGAARAARAGAETERLLKRCHAALLGRE